VIFAELSCCPTPDGAFSLLVVVFAITGLVIVVGFSYLLLVRVCVGAGRGLFLFFLQVVPFFFLPVFAVLELAHETRDQKPEFI